MNTKNVLEKIIAERVSKVEVKRRFLEKIDDFGSIVADTKEECTIPEPNQCTQSGLLLEKFKESVLRALEIYLILDCLLDVYDDAALESSSDTPVDDDFELKGPVMADAIKKYKGERGGAPEERREHLRRAHFVHRLTARGLLPLRIIYEDINGKTNMAGMPVRAFLKYYASEALRGISAMPGLQKSTIKDYRQEFRTLVNIMSELAIGIEYNFPQELQIPDSEAKRFRKDKLLRADQMAKLFYELEREAVTDSTKNQSKVRDLLMFRLLFYIGEQPVDIQELFDLQISKIGIKRCVIHFAKCRVHCPKSFMKLLKAYIGTRDGFAFIGASETPVESTWLNKKLSQMLSKLEIAAKSRGSAKAKIVPSTIQKSAPLIKRSLLEYAHTLENEGHYTKLQRKLGSNYLKPLET